MGQVKDSKYNSLAELPRPYFFVTFRQVGAPRDVAYYVPTAGDPLAAATVLRHEAAAINPDAGAVDAMPLTEYIGAPLFPQRC